MEEQGEKEPTIGRSKEKPVEVLKVVCGLARLARTSETLQQSKSHPSSSSLSRLVTRYTGVGVPRTRAEFLLSREPSEVYRAFHKHKAKKGLLKTWQESWHKSLSTRELHKSQATAADSWGWGRRANGDSAKALCIPLKWWGRASGLREFFSFKTWQWEWRAKGIDYFPQNPPAWL